MLDKVLTDKMTALVSQVLSVLVLTLQRYLRNAYGRPMGGDRVTTQNLKVLKVIPEHNILLVKGSVAGCNGSTLLIEK